MNIKRIKKPLFITLIVCLVLTGIVKILYPEKRAEAQALCDQLAAAMDATVADDGLVSCSYNGNDVASGVLSGSATQLPSDGTTFAALTTGNFSDIPGVPGDFRNTSLGNGLSEDGHDASILTLNFQVPAGSNCLSFDFEFLSEEFPEYVGSAYNDYFYAELDGINISFDTAGNIINVNNNFFDPAITPPNSYDGQTPLLVTTAKVTGGSSITLQFEVGDVGDNWYDTAVFIDNLRIRYRPPGLCQPGTVYVTCTDNDGDGYYQEGGDCGAEDCDDNDPCVNPGMAEGMRCGGCPPFPGPGLCVAPRYYSDTNICSVHCDDNRDNDCDGFADRSDPDCPKEGGLVPCGRIIDDPTTLLRESDPCTLCHIFVLVARVVQFLTKDVAFPLLVLMILIGGFFLLTAAGSISRIEQGKNIIKIAVIAIVLLLAFWVIINTVIFFMTGGEVGGIATIITGQPWNEIACPVCGDNECESGENFVNCPEDCIGYVWVPISGEDRVAQIDITNGTIVERYKTGDDPSRLTIRRGADVWVANRGSGDVTRLAPDMANLPYYNVAATIPVGPGPRGITYDSHGKVWVGNYGNGTIVRIDPGTNTIDWGPYNVGGGPYGAIGDPFGYVWFVNRGNGNIDIVNTNTDPPTVTSKNVLTTDAYGIGMDNEGDVWVVRNADTGEFCELMGARDPINMGSIINCYTYNRCAWGDGRGIAVDGLNNVWVASSCNNTVYKYDKDGNEICSRNFGGTVGQGVVGVAIDNQNNAWVIEHDDPGQVWIVDQSCNNLAFSPVSNIGEFPGIGDFPYNYSDMTGFRSITCPLIKW